MLRRLSHTRDATNSVQAASIILESFGLELGVINGVGRHIRSLHRTAASAWSTTAPADRLPEDLAAVDPQEEAARNEVDVEIDADLRPAVNQIPVTSASPAHPRFNDGPNAAVSISHENWVFESGVLARLADGACSLRYDNTTVLATVASSPGFLYNRRDLRSPPFIVDYREKLYAVGRIPGTYNKREGAPKEHEMLAARRLERALRPLFPRGYSYSTHVTAAVLSADGTCDPEVVAINAASAALMASDIPWAGPLGAARVALINGKIVTNPKPEFEDQYELSLLVAATQDRVLMLEATGSTVPEEEFLKVLRAGVEAARSVIGPQIKLANATGKEKRVSELAGADPAAARRVMDVARQTAGEVLKMPGLDCATRTSALAAAKTKIVNEMRASGSWRAEFARVPGSGCVSNTDVDHAFSAALGTELRSLALTEGLRADGRGPIDLRTLQIHSDYVPVVHGSSVLDAGDTQTLCTATVGSIAEQQRIESLLGGEDTKRLFVHFTLPDFALADGVERGGLSSGPLMRHEMDRSSFVERALLPVLPSEEKFPFAVRLNVEALASDGGTGAAAVCGGTIAMADAGVPLKSLVAAVSVGLVSEGGAWNGEPVRWPDDVEKPLGQYELITDPLGLEISLGDMELRVAGTAGGVTACQLDVQLTGGVPLEIVEEAITRAKIARLRVLKEMEAAVPQSGTTRGAHAPQFGSIKVPATSIGSIIGRDGSNLRAIESSSGAKVNVGQNGELSIFAPSARQFEAARDALRAATGDTLVKGKMYTAKVMTIKDFGAFVSVPGCDMRAMLHVSEVAPERIRAVEDVLKVGDEVQVVYIGRDNRGTLRVSRKAALALKNQNKSSSSEGSSSSGSSDT